jgi:hypothetical protein
MPTATASPNGPAELATQPARLIAAPEPSIESILAAAVDRGIDPVGLEKIAGLYERMMDRRGEQAFNRALAKFHEECPPIVKTREATKEELIPGTKQYRTVRMYGYADLSEITKVIGPALQRNGLVPTWDTTVLENMTVTTCTVRHVDGAAHASSFTCQGVGTKMMNSAQISASAMTYGRRYSLIGVLGLVVDDDDDGRRAAPNPSADADPAAPKVSSRENGHAPINPPVVTKAAIDSLLGRWRKRTGDAWLAANVGGNYEDMRRMVPDALKIAAFGKWAHDVLGPDSPPMTSLGMWTKDAYEMCDQELKQDER